jgi:hypothetical protein
VDSAIVAIAIAVLSGALTIANTVYTSRVSRRVAEQERAASKAERLEELMSRYRDPLLHSAFDLQSRIWNIVEKGFLEIYYNGDQEDARTYARDNTLYVFAEYLGWVELLRREVRFLDLGDEARNVAWTSRLDSVRRSLLTEAHAPPFRLFRGQQRAIGELMISGSPRDGGAECLGFATFTRSLRDPEFASWFAGLREDIDLIARERGRHEDRLRALQGALVDLIEFLDPTHARLPAADLGRLPPA